MTDQETNSQSSRLRRLFKLLILVVLIWAVVTVVRKFIPDSPVDIARKEVEKGDFKAASERYLEYLAKYPEDWGIRSELGFVLAEFDRPGALAELQKVPPESEVYVDVRRRMVDMWIAGERWREAEEGLLDLTQRSPNDAVLQLMLAEVLFRQNRAKLALPYAERSAQLDPNLIRAHSLHAELLDDLGRPAEMIAPLERVVDIEVDNFPAHLNLAYAYTESGQPEKARREATWCLARSPQDVSARRFLAQAARDEGENEEARMEIERALQLAPDDLDCRLLEAELILFQKQPEQALERLKPLYPQHSGDRRLAALLARAAAAAGKTEEAAKYREQVQKLSQ